MWRLRNFLIFVLQIFLFESPPAFASDVRGDGHDPWAVCDWALGGPASGLTRSVEFRSRLALRHTRNPRLMTLRTLKQLRILSPVERSDGSLLIRPPTKTVQIVRATDRDGLEVLRRSDHDFFWRREIMTILIQHGTDATRMTDYAQGVNDLLDSATVNHRFGRFLKKYRNRQISSDGEYVRVPHAHPEYDVMGENPKNYQIFDLSSADVDVATQMSMRVDIPVVIEAVSPNGYSYLAAFRKGRNITHLQTDENPLRDPHAAEKAFRVIQVDGHTPARNPPATITETPTPPWLLEAYEEYKRTGIPNQGPGMMRAFARLEEQKKR